MRTDVNVIRYEFEQRNLYRFTWVQVKLYLDPPGTKRNRPLTDELHITVADGRLLFDFPFSQS